MKNEIWKKIPEFENYEVSNFGNVKRTVFKTKNLQPKLLKFNLSNKGYYKVVLFKNNKRYENFVHRLVMKTFIGKCPDNFEVNHINAVRNDNRLENLEYITRSGNKKHSFQFGLSDTKGTKNGRAKLDELKVKEIKRRLLEGEKQSKLAREFGVTFMTISLIRQGKNWSHVRI